jgi:hypothetical protein
MGVAMSEREAFQIKLASQPLWSTKLRAEAWPNLNYYIEVRTRGLHSNVWCSEPAHALRQLFETHTAASQSGMRSYLKVHADLRQTLEQAGWKDHPLVSAQLFIIFFYQAKVCFTIADEEEKGDNIVSFDHILSDGSGRDKKVDVEGDGFYVSERNVLPPDEAWGAITHFLDTGERLNSRKWDRREYGTRSIADVENGSFKSMLSGKAKS